MKAVDYSIILQNDGGGVGYSFSKIRPENDLVGELGNVASGPVPFMQIFNSVTDCIKQSGKRRGANIGVLRVDHPDIEKFIKSKNGIYSLGNFNISVGLTDEFMTALENEQDYDLINPRTNEVVQSLNARYVFNQIVQMAWKTGDPGGVVFLDRLNEDNPTPHLGNFEATNPCGELPLFAI